MTGTASTVVRCRYCGAPGWITRPIAHAPGCALFDVALNASSPAMLAESGPDLCGRYGGEDVT